MAQRPSQSTRLKGGCPCRRLASFSLAAITPDLCPDVIVLGGKDSSLHAALETPINFTLMVHHIVLYRLKPEVTPARVEEMMMNTRMQLLKIQEVLSIKCGKRIDQEIDWPFFIAIDFESMDKYSIFCEDSIYVKFMEEVIKPNTEDSLVLDFEMDPGKDVRFS
jgi:hypothetical protein